MKTLIVLVICFLAGASGVRAEFRPATVTVPESQAWIGQRVGFFVELRAPGPFSGTAAFDLPRMQGVLLMKIGNPLVGSEEIDGAGLMIQTHKFAVFTQQAGILEVPAFTVRFAHKEGFTGPTVEVQAEVPAWQVDIQRPPDGESLGFLLTTETLEVSETWVPQPGPARVGTMFKRTIVQQADRIPGMALAPVPTAAPEGVRLYPREPEIEDKLERGEFLGKRRDTLTYLLTQPGKVTLPALTYVWWNPQTLVLESTTLPAVSFDVSSAPGTTVSGNASAGHSVQLYVMVAVLAVGLGAWQWSRLAGWGKQCWKILNPPARKAERDLLHACTQNDARAADNTWTVWRNMQNIAFRPDPELHAAVLAMQRQLFGPGPIAAWQGDALALAFRNHLAGQKMRRARADFTLPLLNAEN
jgi:hypothetical protein